MSVVEARAISRFRAATPVTRLLVGTQLAFNVGFFMVLPYLSVYLARDLGLAASVVGLALGLRTFSQQGLFIVGGTLADRFGVKPVVVAGCLVRIAGFLALAASTSLPGVLVSIVLIGFAAALFSPAVEAALAHEVGESERAGGPSRASAFALFAVGGQIGAFTGPLLGTLLLLADFRAACAAAAGVFVLVLGAHLRRLPARPAAHGGQPVLAGWRQVLGNRLFLVFALGYSGQLVAYNQLYLLLPLEVERAWGSAAPLGWLFALSAVLVVAFQLRVTSWCQARPLGRVLTGGFLSMAAGFVVVALAAPAGLTGPAGLGSAVVFVVLLTLGEMIVIPLARALVPRLAGEARLGTHYGLLASAGGLAVLVGGAGLGGVIQLAPDDGPGAALPWVFAAAVPLAGALALRRVLRRLPNTAFHGVVGGTR